MRCFGPARLLMGPAAVATLRVAASAPFFTGSSYNLYNGSNKLAPAFHAAAHGQR
jgi:hypothetical protein